MQQIAPYQIAPQDAQRIQYVVQPQQGQQMKVLTSSVIPQQQNYDQQIQNITHLNSFDNSINYNGQQQPIYVQGNNQSIPKQVLQYSTQPIVNQQAKQIQQIQLNGQPAVPVKVLQTDRFNDTHDDRFRLSNISSITNNNSIYSHSRKASDRLPFTPTIASQIVQPGASQVINPLSTYNQQFYVHQQQKDRLNEIQNKNNQTLNQTITSTYNTRDYNEQRLHTLIKENEQLIKENEYYKKYLSGMPQQQQTNAALQQQVQQLIQQNESLQVQLQIQRDEATMWNNREQELNDRCKGIYEQLQLVKNGDALSLATQNQQMSQRLSQLESTNRSQQTKIDELNACLQVYKDSMKNQGIIDYSTTLPKVASSQGIGVQNYQSYQAPPSTISGMSDFSAKNYQSNNAQIEPYSNIGSDQYAYSSPKQREEMVQSIIKQYKLGSGTPNNKISSINPQSKQIDDYSYAPKPYPTNGTGSNEIFKSYDQDMGDWKTKYDSLTQKLNSLNTGAESTPNKAVY